MAYRILCFDGGPAVATTIRCLQKIEADRPGFLAATDQFVGTSAGAQTALVLAKRLTDGEDGATALAGAADFVSRLLDVYAPDGLDAYLRLLEGKEAMMGNEGVATLLATELGPDLRLGDLAPRVTVTTTRNNRPWRPAVLSNFGPRADPTHSAVEAGVMAGSFPFWMPARRTHVDGAFFTNNPSMAGLAAAIEAASDAAAKIDLMQEAALLSLGGLDGTGVLSNLRVPGDGLLPVLPAAEALPTEPLRDAAAAQDYALRLRSRLLAELKDKLGVDLLQAGPAAEGNENWGWRQWLAYPWNLAYIFQVWINSMGRGEIGNVGGLLGDRAMRLGPVTVLGTNEAFLCEFLGFVDPIVAIADFTAWAWSTPLISEALGFDPDRAATLDWIDAFWPIGESTSRKRG